jgi:hypothetical protein
MRQLPARWYTQFQQLSRTSDWHAQTSADSIPLVSPAIRRLPKVFPSIANVPLMFGRNRTAAAALVAMFNLLATHTQIGPIIVATACLRVVKSSFSAMLLSHGNREINILLRCQLPLPNTLSIVKAPVERKWWSCYTELYSTKTHHCSQSIATNRGHLVIPQLESQQFTQAYPSWILQKSNSPCS